MSKAALPGSMKHRDIIIGVALLAVLAAGVWWARWPSAPAGKAPAADKPAPGDDDVPDVTLADATADVGEVGVTFSVTPNPPIALAGLRVRVRAEAGGSPVAIENGRVSFEMTMPMGDHRYTLIPGSDGWLEAAVVLPT